MSCPFLKSKTPDKNATGCPMGASMSGLSNVSGCPAFKDKKCPVKTQADLNRVSECPAFKNKCPYDTQEITISKAGEQCPAFHQASKKKGCPFSDIGSIKKCPEFAAGCPMSKL